MRVIVWIFAVLAVDAARMMKQQPGGISADCQQELNRLRDPAFQKKSAECEQRGAYPDKVVNLLKDGNQANATKKVEEMFKKCADFSDRCAAEVAPGLIMELRLSGAAVSEKCIAEVGKTNKDPAAKEFAAKCQQSEKTGENILMALNKNDINAAMKVAETSLQKCLKTSKGCAWQLAPVLVNDVVMQAMAAQSQPAAQETPMTVVLTAPKAGIAPEVLKLAVASHKGKAASLLNMAVPKVVLSTGKNSRSSPVLLQQSSKVWVSKLLLTLARQQF